MSLKTSVGEIISQLRIKTLKSLTQNSFFTDPKTKSCFLLKNVKKENHHHHGASTNCCTANQQLSTAAPMERCVSKEVPFASFSKVSYCKEELTATTPVDCAASAAKNLLECQEGVLLLAEKPRNRRIPESEEAGGDDDDDDEGSGEDVATARTVAAIPEPRVREMSPEGRRRMCRAPLLAAAISFSNRLKEKLLVKSGQKRRFFSCMTPHS
jgi:hypothetical protein